MLCLLLIRFNYDLNYFCLRLMTNIYKSMKTLLLMLTFMLKLNNKQIMFYI